MPGKASDEDRLWDTEGTQHEDPEDYVGCWEVTKDMTGKGAALIILVMFIRLLI